MNINLKKHSVYTFIAGSTSAFFTPLVSLAVDEPGVLRNPLERISTLDGLLGAIVNMVQIISVPFIVFFIIYSGFLFVTAQGNQETLAKAKKALIYAIIGGVVVAGASAIGVIIESTAREFTS